MSTVDFIKAWHDAIMRWLSGEITTDELLEFGTIDEYFEYISDMEELE